MDITNTSKADLNVLRTASKKALLFFLFILIKNSTSHSKEVKFRNTKKVLVIRGMVTFTGCGYGRVTPYPFYMKPVQIIYLWMQLLLVEVLLSADFFSTGHAASQSSVANVSMDLQIEKYQ